MSRCVPSWDVDDNPNSVSDQNPNHQKLVLRAPVNSNSVSSILDVPTLDYEVAELTWKNGQIAMHGLGQRRLSSTSTLTKYVWDKPRAAETLEAIVNPATLQPHCKTQMPIYSDELVPWLHHQTATVKPDNVGALSTTTMDALVPSSTRVGSCSGAAAVFGEKKGARGEGSSSGEHSASESSRQVTFETWEKELGVKGLTSTSTGSPENTSSGKQCTTSPDEQDSVCHSRAQREASDAEEKKKGKGKSSVSTKRSRAAAVHNQSERKRRDKINQRMKTLQKLVPNASKTDKASMLDEVIEYLKQLQAQIGMMSRMHMSPMMMPLAMQQQLQMAMMNPMGMGMGMNMPMDLNSINGANHPNIHGMTSSIFHPSTFMPMPSWDHMHSINRAPNVIDPMSAFLACQSQSMTMDAYSRMAVMFQQMQNQPTGLNNFSS